MGIPVRIALREHGDLAEGVLAYRQRITLGPKVEQERVQSDDVLVQRSRRQLCRPLFTGARWTVAAEPLPTLAHAHSPSLAPRVLRSAITGARMRAS
jgi:hypothetical protein